MKRYRHLGDYSPAGSPLLSMYNPDLLYMEANLEEDRLPGVEPGNPVHIKLDAFAEPFRGRVVWVNKSTGAQFALMPRNVVSGEFTHVVQRVPVRIEIERDDRWPHLRAGLSGTVGIAHGPGDAAWAANASRAMKELEMRYNAAEKPERDGRPTATRLDRRGATMTTLAASTPAEIDAPSPIMLEPRHWLAALAMLFVLFAPYQTLVQTVITDDEIRLGVEVDSYDMIWVNVAYLVGFIYGLFTGTVLSVRIGKRDTLVIGLLGILRRKCALRRCDRAFQPRLRPIRRGVWQADVNGRRPRHALQTVRPRAAGGDRLLWRVRVLDASLHSSDQCVYRRVFFMEVDVLGLRPGFVDRDGTRLVFLPTRPAAATGAAATRLARHHHLRGLDHRDRLRLLVVPPMGRVVFKRLRRLRRPLRGLTAGSGSLVGVGSESRRASEARPRLSCVRSEP